MGNKIFVSYKYADSNVMDLAPDNYWELCTVRDYVDEIEKTLKFNTEHIYKGESDGEDLSKLSETTIWEKLKNRIKDSTLTIVLISSNMKDWYKSDKDQWIPREISYSLKEISRINKNGQPITSRTNAMIAVILPDKTGSYSYYMYNQNCCNTHCTTLITDKLFNILKENMFNSKYCKTSLCTNGSKIWHGESSYIESVTWDDFKEDMQKYIDKAYKRQDNIDDYEICKEV